MTGTAALSAMAWVSTYDLLSKIDPFLFAFSKHKSDYDEATEEWRSIGGRGLLAVTMGDPLRPRLRKAAEIRTMCEAAVDHKVLISSVDLQVIQNLDPADIDIAIRRVRSQNDLTKKLRETEEAITVPVRRFRPAFLVSIGLWAAIALVAYGIWRIFA
ncbi:hypothetical protein PMI07_000811 [Rhizobium sp. CF080]|uniref:hypothetical protein n=1 Tax=Rhizobium sp. (strain CF080) TaxID=1144310 RepID=UPI000271D611|nr:hypothetical protein [Rhizobium sp. CF080]EUB97235.1 hypothetical protein PMI07_000811 [Rhizobium sp. CF080]